LARLCTNIENMPNTRYYEVPVKDPNYQEMLKVATSYRMCHSVDEEWVILKINNKDQKGYPFLKKYKKLRHKEAVELKRSKKYQPKIL